MPRMSLAEIEEKAQELAGYLLVAGKQEALLLGIQIKGLRDLAQIMGTVAYRKEREAAPIPPQVFPYAPVPEPTKHAVDRLHELLSYLVQESEAAHRRSQEADAASELGKSARQLSICKAYDDAATKLSEILNEGGI